VIPLLIAAWAGHTEQSREMAKSLTAALKHHDLKHETAAQYMGLGFEDLCKQLAGTKPLNLWRIAYLPRVVYTTYLRLEARRFGADLLTAEDRALILSAASIGWKRMAKIVPDLFNHQRSA
jgi:hypothetical protein